MVWNNFPKPCYYLSKTDNRVHFLHEIFKKIQNFQLLFLPFIFLNGTDRVKNDEVLHKRQGGKSRPTNNKTKEGLLPESHLA